MQEKEPKIICLGVPKIKEDNKLIFDNNYNIWRRDRKEKAGGVMAVTGKGLLVKSITYGEGKAEVASVKLEGKGREVMSIIVTCVPPRTDLCRSDEHEGMIKTHWGA